MDTGGVVALIGTHRAVLFGISVMRFAVIS